MNSDLILQNIAQVVELDTEETALFISLLREKSVNRKQFLLQKRQIATYYNLRSIAWNVIGWVMANFFTVISHIILGHLTVR